MTLRYCVGIDLGSTTTKAVVLAEDASVLGRGITNSRSNYAIACQVALSEALIAARFGLLAREMDASTLHAFGLLFRRAQYRGQLRTLSGILLRFAHGTGLEGAVEAILRRMDEEAPALCGIL